MFGVLWKLDAMLISAVAFKHFYCQEYNIPELIKLSIPWKTP